MKIIQKTERQSFREGSDKKATLKQELQIIQEKYEQFQKTNETMKWLALDLRDKLQQVTTRLNQTVYDAFIDNDVKEDVFAESGAATSHNIFMSSEGHRTLLTHLKEKRHLTDWELLEDDIKRSVIIIHRPYQQIIYRHGLGEEIVFRMSEADNQEPKKEQSKDTPSELSQVKADVDTSQGVNDSEEIEQSVMNKEEENIPDLMKSNEVDRQRNQITNLQEQLAWEKRSQSNKTATQAQTNDSTRQDKKTTTSPKIKSPTFRELQQAEHIYSKPSFDDKRKTTTHINRNINPAVQPSYTNDQLEEKKISPRKIEPDEQKNTQKTDEKTVNADHEKPKEEVTSKQTTKNSTQEQTHQISATDQAKEALPKIENLNTHETNSVNEVKQADHQEHNKHPNVDQFNVDEEKAQTEMTSDQQPTRTQTKHEKKPTFFKSLWGRFK